MAQLACHEHVVNVPVHKLRHYERHYHLQLCESYGSWIARYCNALSRVRTISLFSTYFDWESSQVLTITAIFSGRDVTVREKLLYDVDMYLIRQIFDHEPALLQHPL